MKTLVDVNKLKSLVVRENTVTVRRLMSAINRVDKEDAIPISWLQEQANIYDGNGMDEIADGIRELIDVYRS